MSPEAPASVQVQRRHSERVLLRIPISVKGKDLQGKAFSEQTCTLVINRDGARINLKNNVKSDDRVMITNLLSRITVPFRVVGQAGQSMGEGPEFGVECLEENLEFWGILFPEKNSGKGAKPDGPDLVDALIECCACNFRELAQLRMAQYRILSTRSVLVRQCVQCDAPTDWRYAAVDAANGKAVAGAQGQKAAGGSERRRAKRMTVKLPVRIRMADGREEITRTENLSTTGVCFIANQKMKVGETINLTVGYEPGKNAAEIPARVIWSQPQEGTAHTVYGVHLHEG